MGAKADGLNQFRETVREISPEDIQGLREYISSIEKLNEILDGIKPTYAEILDLQKAGAGPEELNKVAGKLLVQVNSYPIPQDIELPQAITSKIGNLPLASTLLQEMCANIAATYDQRLTTNMYKNPFRLSLWMEKLSDSMQKAKSFLFEINKSRNI
ncbi:MAG: hypothetical protein WC794_02565 [Candidatus Doudnabacteria bacterium]|jgi:hypothetical protein